MKKIVTFEASIGENDEGKIVWEYEFTEQWFGSGEKQTNKSVKGFDTEEEAAADLLKTLTYVMTGNI